MFQMAVHRSERPMYRFVIKIVNINKKINSLSILSCIQTQGTHFLIAGGKCQIWEVLQNML